MRINCNNKIIHTFQANGWYLVLIFILSAEEIPAYCRKTNNLRMIADIGFLTSPTATERIQKDTVRKARFYSHRYLIPKHFNQPHFFTHAIVGMDVKLCTSFVYPCVPKSIYNIIFMLEHFRDLISDQRASRTRNVEHVLSTWFKHVCPDSGWIFTENVAENLSP